MEAPRHLHLIQVVLHPPAPLAVWGIGRTPMPTNSAPNVAVTRQQVIREQCHPAPVSASLVTTCLLKSVELVPWAATKRLLATKPAPYVARVSTGQVWVPPIRTLARIVQVKNTTVILEPQVANAVVMARIPNRGRSL